MGGGDKALLSLGGQPLLTHVIERLRPQVSELGLNANGDGARFESFGLPIFSDDIEDFAGPLAGVLAGMEWASSCGHDYIVTAAADTPFLPCDLVPKLLLAGESAPVALAASPDPERGLSRHPTFGLWSVGLRDDLRKSLLAGVRKVVEWTDKHGRSDAVFSGYDTDPFFNVNRPEDLEKAERMLA